MGDKFISAIGDMVDQALERGLDPPFVALIRNDNPHAIRIPEGRMWPLDLGTTEGSAKVWIAKESDPFEGSVFNAPDVIKLMTLDDYQSIRSPKQ